MTDSERSSGSAPGLSERAALFPEAALLADVLARSPWPLARTSGPVPCLLAPESAGLSAWRALPREEAHAGLTHDELALLSRYGPSLVTLERPLARQVASWLSRLARPRADLGLEAGSGVGADARLLRGFVRRVLALDLAPAAVEVARRQLAGEAVPRLERREGRSYATRPPLQLPPLSGCLAAVGDVLDLPVVEGAADVALALNLLDNVADPLGALTQLGRALRPGGLLIVASPFAWRDDLTPPEGQLGGGTIPALVAMGSATALHAVLRGETPLAPALPRFEVLETAEVPWEVVDHARCTVRFLTHALAARRLS